MKVTKETPLSEMTLRRYERPDNLKGRELVKKLCLSLGLLQPGDSRDVIVDILSVLIQAGRKKKALICADIEKAVIASRKKAKLPLVGIAQSNIRRQLRRMKEMMLVESVANAYRITEFDSLRNIFEERMKRFYLESITQRIGEYCEKLDG
jgi:hypothetical protein